jgi:hypothetical protein
MKTFFKVIALVLLTCATTFAQTFEGKLTYQNSFKSKMPNITDELFTEMMGKTWVYSMKGASYHNACNGTLLQWQMYLPKDNKVYSKFSNTPAIFWNDGAVNADSVIKTELNKNVLTILGNNCDELILTCKSGVQKYYFSSKYKVDPAPFKNHKFGNWYDYISLAKAMPLKIILETVQFSLESVATAVTGEKIDDQLFALPPDAKLEKSPF